MNERDVRGGGYVRVFRVPCFMVYVWLFLCIFRAPSVCLPLHSVCSASACYRFHFYLRLSSICWYVGSYHICLILFPAVSPCCVLCRPAAAAAVLYAIRMYVHIAPMFHVGTAVDLVGPCLYHTSNPYSSTPAAAAAGSSGNNSRVLCQRQPEGAGALLLFPRDDWLMRRAIDGWMLMILMLVTAAAVDVVSIIFWRWWRWCCCNVPGLRSWHWGSGPIN